MVHGFVDNVHPRTRYREKTVAISRRSSDRALKNFTIAQARIFGAADVASQRV
jgi:hypothetical protein